MKPINITTYADWAKYNNISTVIITNKKKATGYLRFNNRTWRELHDPRGKDFDSSRMETLREFIEHNQQNIFINGMLQLLNYNISRIYNNTISECYTDEPEFYKLKYSEFIVNLHNNHDLHNVNYKSENYIFNGLECKFTPVNELLHDKILCDTKISHRIFHIKNIVNTNLVDDIFKSLINNPDILCRYRELAYNLLVIPEKTIIFYDSECFQLTEWIKDLLFDFFGEKSFIYSSNYYDFQEKTEQHINNNTPRCVIIDEPNIKIKKQINTFQKLGFKNIIVNDKSKQKNNIYNFLNLEKYVETNKDNLIECIETEVGYKLNGESLHHIIKRFIGIDSLFYSGELFRINFLYWCCKKNN